VKARHLCAILGVAIAVGSVTFFESLVTTNDAQAPMIARRLSAPWSAWSVEGVRLFGRGRPPAAEKVSAPPCTVPADLTLPVVQMQIDYRPDGRVLQGPPMMAVVAPAPTNSPYAAAPLAEGRWVDESSETPEIVCTRGTMTRFGRGKPAPLGSVVKFIGEKGAVAFTIVGYLDAARLPGGWPGAFANAAAFGCLDAERKGSARFWKSLPAHAERLDTPESIAFQFTSEAGRNLDRSKALLLWAAALTALCLLLNSLFLSIEARRKDIAILRMLGMTRSGVLRQVLGESVVLSAWGALLGCVGAVAVLFAYVAADKTTYPMGMAVSVKCMLICLAVTPLVAVVAAALALKPALSVRPLEAASDRMPCKRHLGMLIAFACGFGAFVAVEVWGASLMSAFVPAKEWPDAIVSILPGGVSSFDIAKLQGKLKGVRRIHELAPLQVNFDPLEPMSGPAKFAGRGPQYRNVLLLGSDWLPNFRFVAGDPAQAAEAIASGDNCVITEMMARSRKLKLGDELRLDAGRELKVTLKVVGIVDCNWHMVTSRALVRGLNRMPSNTDGPAFVSFDTIEACDPRPAPMVNMTHVWLDYTPGFLAAHGAFEAGRLVEKEIVEALGGAYRMDEDEQVFGNAVRLHSRDEIADGTLSHGNDIIGSMARVPFIFVAVISLGFVAMLVASADGRRREFVVLRTVGATWLQLAAVLVKEALATALVGVVIGLPGGALVGWLFTSGTRAAMANWGIPPNFAVPWLVVFKGMVGSIAFALAVAVPVALLIVRKVAKRRIQD